MMTCCEKGNNLLAMPLDCILSRSLELCRSDCWMTFKMKKWLSLLKSIVFSFMIYMWFLGSSLLIQIDSESKQQPESTYIPLSNSQWTTQLSKLLQNVHVHCQKNEHRKFSDSKNRSSDYLANKILFRARKEKIVRDNLIYIPEMKQMWCLVPKVRIGYHLDNLHFYVTKRNEFFLPF